MTSLSGKGRNEKTAEMAEFGGISRLGNLMLGTLIIAKSLFNLFPTHGKFHGEWTQILGIAKDGT